MYVSAFEVLFKEVIQLLLFDWGQGVDFSAECLTIRDKFNCVVPLLLIQEFIKGLLSKDVSELSVGLKNYVLKACQMSLSCCLPKLLGDCLSSLDLFQMLTKEAYEELVSSVHTIQVRMCEA